MLPEELENSCQMYGVEFDSISGRIAQQLYQKSTIAVQGYEKTNIPDNFFDVAIGNVPFGEIRVNDSRYNSRNLFIHDYFFEKTLDKIRPGGVMAFITSKGTMDKEDNTIRKYLSQRAELIGAIRLPNNTFTKNAGTEVTSDIIFLKKRDKITDIEEEWVNVDTAENGIRMNKYFIDNPQMIMGQMKTKTNQYGKEISVCEEIEGSDLDYMLSNAISYLQAEMEEFDLDELIEDEENSIQADPNVSNYSFTIIDDKVYYRENSRMYEKDLPSTTISRIKGMVEIRNCARHLINLQLEDEPDEEIKAEQEKLNRLYDNFVKKYGRINTRGNNQAFSDDSSYYLLCSLEVLDSKGNFERKADMFNKRTILAKKEITRADTANDALILSLTERGKIDIDYMKKLTKKTEEELVKELEGQIFREPNTLAEERKYVTADEYLSGNVREKLYLAKRLAEHYPEFEINVRELEKVIPKDIKASEIAVKLGATWIPQEIVEQFVYELLETDYYKRRKIKVVYSEHSTGWNITGKSADKNNVLANKKYGLDSRVNAYRIIEDTLNLRNTKVTIEIKDENGDKKRVLDKQRTAIAQAKQDEIKLKFEEWIFKDQDRREKLEKLYNDKFNAIRNREYDGSHLKFYGINPEIKLRPHQVNAIARILYNGNTLLAHEVGAGKTFEMVAAAMESKRMGLCNKSLFVVPNHIVEQFSSEFLQLYPSANILVTTKKDFAKNNRKKFCSKIATGDFDAIIISHSQFEKIPMSVERQRYFLEKQINEIMEGIEELKWMNGERFSIRQLEITRDNLKTRLEKLNKTDNKDDVITFEELGVDRLFVDEAHYYKNLFLQSKMKNISGVSNGDAQKSSDMFMKCQYMDEITDGKGIIFATGTPISNSISELYTMQRYLQYNTLLKNHLQHFDSWASTFGETVTAIELAPEGDKFKIKTRFSRFNNIPELMTLFREIADIQTAETLDLPVPKMERRNIAVEASELQKDMVKKLGERAEAIRSGAVNIRQDNMLNITNEGRKLALDQRLINDMLPDFENSKVNVCANNIYEYWEKYKDKKSTQLVFCDLSVPNKNKTIPMRENEEGVYEIDKEEIQEVFTDVYNDLKQKLIAKGIPSEEIAFIHEADTEAKKEAIFDKVRSGEIRVLMGSTLKMGAGTNVQDKIIGVHHLDCTWRSSDFTQRNGRALRQGNENPIVYIFSYVTKGTFDAYMYQLVERKQKSISQIMTSKTPIRSMEDVDERALDYAEIKGLASGNPLIQEKTELEGKVAKLRILKQSYLSQKYDLEDMVKRKLPQQMKEYENRIANLKIDNQYLKENTKLNADNFSTMKIENEIYTEKAKAGEKILSLCKKIKDTESIFIGEYRGFKMELEFNSFEKAFQIVLSNKDSYRAVLGNDKIGVITRLNNVLDSIEKRISYNEMQLQNLEKQFKDAKENMEIPFSKEKELQESSSRLKEVNKLLKIGGKEDREANIFDDEDDIEIEEDTKQKDKDYER